MQCEDCDEGKYQDQSGNSSCSICAIGKYLDEKGKSGCNECDANGDCIAGEQRSINEDTMKSSGSTSLVAKTSVIAIACIAILKAF